MELTNFEISREAFDHYNPEDLKFRAKIGLNEEIIRTFSKTSMNLSGCLTSD